VPRVGAFPASATWLRQNAGRRRIGCIVLRSVMPMRQPGCPAAARSLRVSVSFGPVRA
jgi:hypothetical protein